MKFSEVITRTLSNPEFHEPKISLRLGSMGINISKSPVVTIDTAPDEIERSLHWDFQYIITRNAFMHLGEFNYNKNGIINEMKHELVSRISINMGLQRKKLSKHARDALCNTRLINRLDLTSFSQLDDLYSLYVYTNKQNSKEHRTVQYKLIECLHNRLSKEQ
jgi:hypothetical protein